MKLILSRHGNTFSPGDKVVWAGSRNDLPLVPEGIAQAERLAEVLIHNRIVLSAIFCGPLQRTQKYAEIIGERLGLAQKPRVDLRLNEIDYGAWTGLSGDEVIQRFGEADLKAWEERSSWPTQGGWTGSEAQAISETHSFTSDLSKEFKKESDCVLVVTSNGRLRYFLSLVEGEFQRKVQDRSFKVKTGNICLMDIEKSGNAVRYWDQNPIIISILKE